MDAIATALITAIVPFLLSLFGTHRSDKNDEDLQKSAILLGLKEEAQELQNRRKERIRKYVRRPSGYFWMQLASIYIVLILIGGAVYWANTFPNPVVQNSALTVIAAVLSVALIYLLVVQLKTVDTRTDNEDKPGKPNQSATTPSDDPDSAETTAPQDDTPPGHGPDQIRA